MITDDIVEGITRVLNRTATPNPAWSGLEPDPATSFAPFQIYNIGNSSPVKLMDIAAVEKNLGVKAKMNFLPMQAGDVPVAASDVRDLERDVGFKPATTIQEGVKRFVEWYRGYYKV